MPETRAALRRRRWAFGVAVVLAALGVAFLGWSVVQHREARDDLQDARSQLAIRRANTSTEARSLQRALQQVTSVGNQLGALPKGTSDLADLDERDLEAVRGAIQAGLAGNLTGYNAAVDQRTALDPQHDTLVEQLRQQVNAVITAFDPLATSSG
ncbi:MAG TPA: hypothetical protein VFW97_02725 [Acidimicrobiia bacterium]|nr:hypothetical protein [Acidimicrobiia bacterium]